MKITEIFERSVLLVPATLVGLGIGASLLAASPALASLAGVGLPLVFVIFVGVRKILAVPGDASVQEATPGWPLGRRILPSVTLMLGGAVVGFLALVTVTAATFSLVAYCGFMWFSVGFVVSGVRMILGRRVCRCWRMSLLGVMVVLLMSRITGVAT